MYHTKTKSKIAFVSLAAICCFVSYQNCSPYHSSANTTDFANAQGVDIAARKLLETHCSFCHGGTNALGGVSHIEDTDALVLAGLIIPGDSVNSRISAAPAEGTMPKSYQLNPDEILLLQQWVENLITQYPPTPPPPSIPNCTISASNTLINSGQSVTFTLSVQGTADAALLNGVAISQTGGSITLSPTTDTMISGQVSNSQGNNLCNSPLVRVTTVPPPSNVPSCTLTATPQNFIPGDSVVLSLTISGTATAASIQGTSVPVSTPSLSINPLVTSTYSANVSNSSGSSSCSLSVTSKSAALMTSDEFYRAKIGPNNKSIDDMITVGRCINCHTSNPPPGYSMASTYYTLVSGQTSQNLSKIKNIVSPSNPANVWDLTATTRGLYQFASGHKKNVSTYGYSFTAAELTHIQNFVNKP